MKKISSRSVVLLLAVAALVGALATTGAFASSGKKKASIQVCVLLPDTKSSVRWVQFDAPAFATALKAAGVTYSINNALNDPQKQKAQAQACLAAGATVVVEPDELRRAVTSIDCGALMKLSRMAGLCGNSRGSFS